MGPCEYVISSLASYKSQIIGCEIKSNFYLHTHTHARTHEHTHAPITITTTTNNNNNNNKETQRENEVIPCCTLLERFLPQRLQWASDIFKASCIQISGIFKLFSCPGQSCSLPLLQTIGYIRIYSVIGYIQTHSLSLARTCFAYFHSPPPHPHPNIQIFAYIYVFVPTRSHRRLYPSVCVCVFVLYALM